MRCTAARYGTSQARLQEDFAPTHQFRRRLVQHDRLVFRGVVPRQVWLLHALAIDDAGLIRPEQITSEPRFSKTRRPLQDEKLRARSPQSVPRQVLQLPFLDGRQSFEAILRSLEGSFSISLAPLHDGFLLQILPRAQVIQTRRDAIPAEDDLLARLYRRELLCFHWLKIHSALRTEDVHLGEFVA